MRHARSTHGLRLFAPSNMPTRHSALSLTVCACDLPLNGSYHNLVYSKLFIYNYNLISLEMYKRSSLRLYTKCTLETCRQSNINFSFDLT